MVVIFLKRMVTLDPKMGPHSPQGQGSRRFHFRHKFTIVFNMGWKLPCRVNLQPYKADNHPSKLPPQVQGGFCSKGGSTTRVEEVSAPKTRI